jgi:hypothetical protein
MFWRPNLACGYVWGTTHRVQIAFIIKAARPLSCASQPPFQHGSELTQTDPERPQFNYIEAALTPLALAV